MSVKKKAYRVLQRAAFVDILTIDSFVQNLIRYFCPELHKLLPLKCKEQQGNFQLENGKNLSQFATGLIPKSSTPWWCYIDPEHTIWERNGLIRNGLIEAMTL